MENIVIVVSEDGKTATITIDLTQRNGISSSGKSISVASTKGNKPIEGTDVILGLNAYISNKR